MRQLSGKNMLTAAITTMDIRSSYQKKEVWRGLPEAFGMMWLV